MYQAREWLAAAGEIQRLGVLTSWDALVAGSVNEVAWGTSDREEGLQDITVKLTTHVCCRAVGHQVNDEVVCVWSDKSGERGGEVVWVVQERVIGSVLGLVGGLVVCETIGAEQAV